MNTYSNCRFNRFSVFIVEGDIDSLNLDDLTIDQIFHNVPDRCLGDFAHDHLRIFREGSFRCFDGHKDSVGHFHEGLLRHVEFIFRRNRHITRNNRFRIDNLTSFILPLYKGISVHFRPRRNFSDRLPLFYSKSRDDNAIPVNECHGILCRFVFFLFFFFFVSIILIVSVFSVFFLRRFLRRVSLILCDIGLIFNHTGLILSRSLDSLFLDAFFRLSSLLRDFSRFFSRCLFSSAFLRLCRSRFFCLLSIGPACRLLVLFRRSHRGRFVCSGCGGIGGVCRRFLQPGHLHALTIGDRGRTCRVRFCYVGCEHVHGGVRQQHHHGKQLRQNSSSVILVFFHVFSLLYVFSKGFCIFKMTFCCKCHDINLICHDVSSVVRFMIS